MRERDREHRLGARVLSFARKRLERDGEAQHRTHLAFGHRLQEGERATGAGRRERRVDVDARCLERAREAGCRRAADATEDRRAASTERRDQMPADARLSEHARTHELRRRGLRGAVRGVGLAAVPDPQMRELDAGDAAARDRASRRPQRGDERSLVVDQRRPRVVGEVLRLDRPRGVHAEVALGAGERGRRRDRSAASHVVHEHHRLEVPRRRVAEMEPTGRGRPPAPERRHLAIAQAAVLQAPLGDRREPGDDGAPAPGQHACASLHRERSRAGSHRAASSARTRCARAAPARSRASSAPADGGTRPARCARPARGCRPRRAARAGRREAGPCRAPRARRRSVRCAVARVRRRPVRPSRRAGLPASVRCETGEPSARSWLPPTTNVRTSQTASPPARKATSG